MFAKWLEEFKRISLKTKFFSQLAIFLVAIITALSLYDVARYLYINSEYKWFFEIHLLFPAVIFQFSIFVIFGSRFVLSFFNSKNSFLVHQILWLSGIITLAVYWFISRPDPEPDLELFGVYSTFGPEIFRHASQYFAPLGISYLLLSPTRRLVMFVYSLIKVWRNKI